MTYFMDRINHGLCEPNFKINESSSLKIAVVFFFLVISLAIIYICVVRRRWGGEGGSA